MDLASVIPKEFQDMRPLRGLGFLGPFAFNTEAFTRQQNKPAHQGEPLNPKRLTP